MIKILSSRFSYISGSDLVSFGCGCGKEFKSYIKNESELLDIKCPLCGCEMYNDKEEDKKEIDIIDSEILENMSGGEIDTIRDKVKSDRKMYLTYWRLNKKGLIDAKSFKDVSDFIGWSMLNGFREYKTLERLDESKLYSKDNCRWASVRRKNWKITDDRVKVAVELESARRSLIAALSFEDVLNEELLLELGSGLDCIIKSIASLDNLGDTM